MSQVNELLAEAKERVAINVGAILLKGRVVIAYDEEDLIDMLKTVPNYPAVGIVYEGMRSIPENKPTENVGLSCVMGLSLTLIDQDPTLQRSNQKRIRAIDYLDMMRDQFLGTRSTVTQHKWHFLVESPASLKSGVIAWVQRWQVPVQLRPTQPQVRSS